MPLLDYPLDKLKTYRGRNPRPHDFDEFWDTALAEMHAIDANITLVPHTMRAPFVECFHLYFTGVGNARIHAKYLRPAHTIVPHPAVVMFHGYSGNSGDWSDKLSYVANGFSVLALDCRGQGGLSQDTGGVVGTTLDGHLIRGLADKPEKLLYRQIFLDCAQLAGIAMAMPEVDATRVCATGGSQGGGLTLACAALEPRIARAAAIYPFLCDYQRAMEMDVPNYGYGEIERYFRLFDPTHEYENEVYNKLGYTDNQHLATRIQANTLIITALMDNVCPPSTQFAAYNKITAKKRMRIYPDFGHESLPSMNDEIFNFFSELCNSPTSEIRHATA